MPLALEIPHTPALLAIEPGPSRARRLSITDGRGDFAGLGNSLFVMIGGLALEGRLVGVSGVVGGR